MAVAGNEEPDGDVDNDDDDDDERGTAISGVGA